MVETFVGEEVDIKSNLNVAGIATFNGDLDVNANVDLGDDNKLLFGVMMIGEIKIEPSTNDLFKVNTATGKLLLDSAEPRLILEEMLLFWYHFTFENGEGNII